MARVDARELDSSPDQHGRFPGWWVVAGCFTVLAVSSGLGFYGLAVYLNAISKERDWPLSTISLATTVFFVVGGVVGVWVARWIARYDVRLVIVGGGLVGGFALGVLGQVEQQWQLFVVYAVFAAGWSAAGLIPATTVVTRWFHAKRSVALSVASTGLSVGGIVITPFAKQLLDSRGLAAGTPWLGALFVVGIVPVAWFLVRADPEAEGWAPDGIRREVGEIAPPPSGTPFARGDPHALLRRRHGRLPAGARCTGGRHPAAGQARRGSHRRTHRAVRAHGDRRDVGGGAPDRRAGGAAGSDDAAHGGPRGSPRRWRWR